MRKTAIILSLLCCTAIAMLVSCGDDEESSSRKKKKADSSSAISVSSEASSMESSIKLTDVSEWATGDLWNDGFCDIYHYVESGKNSVGDDMDIEFTVDNLKITMEKRGEYDAFIHTLDDSVPEQAQLINAWDKMMEQTDILYQKAISDTPRPSDETYEFNTDLFKQYFDTFYELSYEIKDPVFK